MKRYIVAEKDCEFCHGSGEYYGGYTLNYDEYELCDCLHESNLIEYLQIRFSDFRHWVKRLWEVL